MSYGATFKGSICSLWGGESEKKGKSENGRVEQIIPLIEPELEQIKACIKAHFLPSKTVYN